jgi:hypothetical protein
MASVKEYLTQLGKKGGKARAKKMTAEERIESARRAANARWSKQNKDLTELAERSKETAERSKELLKTAQANERRALARLAKQKKKTSL